MRPSPQPRTRLTRLQKLTLCQKAHDSPGSSYKQLAEWAQDEFGLAAAPHKGTICRILKAHQDLRIQRSEFGSEKKRMPAAQLQLDGTEKLPMLFLGTAEKPRWYKKKPHSLQYMGTSKGWMTTWVYQQWLVHLEEEKAAKNRHILLLVDNASSHDDTSHGSVLEARTCREAAAEYDRKNSADGPRDYLLCQT
ncbi:hypothetical protein PF011_g15190 [Phytophthora fragariae]|uniref:DDE-1 domain-containing protein n=1 Tax=Phytophthora fragariae TaxID=53985 RepID=A0A6A3JTE5_9STRA|nr:hypothetical protein PF011_g15190 [Phytophthora fragariae]